MLRLQSVNKFVQHVKKQSVSRKATVNSAFLSPGVLDLNWGEGPGSTAQLEEE